MTGAPQFPEGPAQSVADAYSGNWVDRFAPQITRPYLRLSRVDRPIGTWLLFIPCLWGVSLAAMADGFRMWDLWLGVSCAAGALLMRGAGCTWNDVTDRHLDAQVARTRSRPLPSGQVSVRGALIWMVVQALIAAYILSTYNTLSITLGIASLALVAVYPFAKRFTWWPQVFLGLAFNWGALLGYAAHAGQITPAAMALYVGGIFWTLFYDTIYAHQDKEDDALIGIKSTARLFADKSRTWLFGFAIVTTAFLGAATILTPVRPDHPLSLLVALAGTWAFGAHMLWQLRNLDLNDPDSCMMTFRATRNGGLIVALFLALAAWL